MTRPTLKEFLNSKWFIKRPKHIQKAARKYPPGIYLLRSTGQKVLLYCYEENKDRSVTCKVDVTPEIEPTCLTPRRVFGISLKDLKPVDVLK